MLHFNSFGKQDKNNPCYCYSAWRNSPIENSLSNCTLYCFASTWFTSLFICLLIISTYTDCIRGHIKYKNRVVAALIPKGIYIAVLFQDHQLPHQDNDIPGSFSAEALHPCFKKAQTLKDFLKFLFSWQCHSAEVGGFLSGSTADGLRVTISSTLSLLDYLVSHGFKYVMTTRLSQDPLQNFFGIVRQSCGSNDQPKPMQFLIVVNCLSFYNLAKTVH